jgi:hypothetical protein
MRQDSHSETEIGRREILPNVKSLSAQLHFGQEIGKGGDFHSSVRFVAQRLQKWRAHVERLPLAAVTS